MSTIVICQFRQISKMQYEIPFFVQCNQQANGLNLAKRLKKIKIVKSRSDELLIEYSSFFLQISDVCRKKRSVTWICKLIFQNCVSLKYIPCIW